ncbi:hypothetical protein KUTeg_001451 [Tegillarca granosa]|uniref:Uncharacterized protein n=1 Tax=Tegillarca granosa TaxID=220873 RepID=A0ABQ9FRH2_TEGGR|nr:hypothetical protein KUTeg_001451 [Tegillarca granosa]
MNLSKTTKIHEKLRQALDRRQEEIVFPELMTCAMGGKADQLYCLLEEGDCINSKSGVGNWPLYLAVENGHLDVRGADVKKRHLPTGSTVLHIAAKMGHLDVLEYLLAFCKSSRGWHGYIRMVKTLLANGATTALLDKNGFLFSLPEFGGVWSEVEATRQRHTKLILCCLADKSKKGLIDLQKTWLSAVYPQCIVEEVDGEENQSDVDSGILLTSGYRSTPITEDGMKTEGIDINILTLDGLLAEEMTSNKNIIKIVHKARKGQPVRPRKQSFAGVMSPSIPDSGPNLNPPSTQEASSINFEKVHYRYETLRKDSSKKIDNK